MSNNLSGTYKLIDSDGVEAGLGTFTHFRDNRVIGHVRRYIHADKQAGAVIPPIVYQYEGFLIEDQLCLAWNSPGRTICGVLLLMVLEGGRLQGKTMFRNPEKKEITAPGDVTFERL